MHNNLLAGPGASHCQFYTLHLPDRDVSQAWKQAPCFVLLSLDSGGKSQACPVHDARHWNTEQRPSTAISSQRRATLKTPMRRFFLLVAR